MIDTKLESKIVLITGANHGIGRATVQAFAAQGALVFCAYFREACPDSDEELRHARETGVGGQVLYRAMQQLSAEPLLQEIRSRGWRCWAHETDLINSDNIPRLFDLCEAQLGPVDILVNNHACCVPETFDPALIKDKSSGVQLATSAVIDKHFAVNARACALMMTEYLKRYLQRKGISGRIINLSTDAAHGHKANISYAASKHAVESYSRSAAAEMGKYGITVNIVAPGPIQTGYLTPNAEADNARYTPLHRVGQPDDVADVIVFLASEQARWLTGQLLYVGGGYRMSQ